jgi:hypothetical protein
MSQPMPAAFATDPEAVPGRDRASRFGPVSEVTR